MLLKRNLHCTEKAADGIGFATAEQFVSEGAYVYITGRREKELDAAVAKIGKNIAAVKGMFPTWKTLTGSTGRLQRIRGVLTLSLLMLA
jgi:NAD(P)-dependent dehydrogenase (short-subunit alcohol dehydrogenase family)